MATFDEHIYQAKENLKFLESVTTKIDDHWDWKVTICFYVSVHLINAHISKFGLHYRTHKDVENAINPEKLSSPSKLDEDSYLQYLKLRNLSRRSRYLCHDKPNIPNEHAYHTFDKHFAKALPHLDGLLAYMSNAYNVKFDKVSVKCIELKKHKFKIFNIVS